MVRDVELSARIAELHAMERRHDLFAFRVDGWSAWRVMRFAVQMLVLDLPLAQPARPTLTRSLEALGATLKLLWLLLAGRQRDLVVSTCRSALRMQLGAKYRDVYFDGLLVKGYSCLKIEEINSPDFDRQAAAAWRPADLNSVVFTFWGRVLGLLFPVKAAAFCKSVAQVLSSDLHLSVDHRWLLMRVSTVYWQSRLYSVLFSRIRPKAVLVAEPGCYGLRVASKRNGVRVIELQHGVFDVNHPDAVPGWVRGQPGELLLPDILACRGQFWIDQLNGTRQKEPAVAVGNELIDFARQRRRPRAKGQSIHLVLTSQGLDSRRLVRWIVEMAAAAPEQLDWRLSIKLHPLYDSGSREFDPLRSHPRMRVIGGAEEPNVFDLLADADLHLSIASACHFDAAALGVPSAIIPLAGHEALLHVADGVQLFVAKFPADVWVPDRPGSSRARMHYFAQPGFVENLERVVVGHSDPEARHQAARGARIARSEL